jgi:hypothetical protein
VPERKVIGLENNKYEKLKKRVKRLLKLLKGAE